MFLQQIDGTLVCVGGIIVATHTLLKSQCKIDGTHHVGIVFLCFVVKDKATLPKWCHALNALELVGLFSFVAQDGELVAS